MVRPSDGTITPAEHEVLEVLALGPCATSGHTECGPKWRFVDLATCRRLQKAGMVVIDVGGWASLVNETES